MYDYTVRQSRMHEGLDRRTHLAGRRTGIAFGKIAVLPQAVSGVCEVDRNENFVALGVSQPFAGRFYPQNAIQLYRSVSGAGLHE
jgi:hypothetical protein